MLVNNRSSSNLIGLKRQSLPQRRQAKMHEADGKTLSSACKGTKTTDRVHQARRWLFDSWWWNEEYGGQDQRLAQAGSVPQLSARKRQRSGMSAVVWLR